LARAKGMAAGGADKKIQAAYRGAIVLPVQQIRRGGYRERERLRFRFFGLYFGFALAGKSGGQIGGDHLGTGSVGLGGRLTEA